MIALSEPDIYLYGATEKTTPYTEVDKETGLKMTVRIGDDKTVSDQIFSDIFCSLTFADAINVAMNKTLIDFCSDIEVEETYIVTEKPTNKVTINMKYIPKNPSKRDHIPHSTITSDTAMVVLKGEGFSVTQPLNYLRGTSMRILWLDIYGDDLEKLDDTLNIFIRSDGALSDKYILHSVSPVKRDILLSDFKQFKAWLDAVSHTIKCIK